MLVVTTIVLISLCLTWTTQAAPTQWNTNYPSLKDQLYKSIISQAFVQQEDSPSIKDKDKDMAATYCKLLYQILHSISADLVDGSVDDYCKNIELPAVTEPRPEERNSKLVKTLYQEILKVLKNTGLNGYPFGDLING